MAENPAEMVLSVRDGSEWTERARLPHVDPVPALDTRALSLDDINSVTPADPVVVGDQVRIAYVDQTNTLVRGFVFDATTEGLLLVETIEG